MNFPLRPAAMTGANARQTGFSVSFRADVA
jgi:hypothetical protein